VQRPPHEELAAVVARSSHSAAARRYGVSAATIYRWLRRAAI
jgi:transposase